MKKSGRVTITLVAAVAMAGCTKTRLSQVRRCVDQNSIEADDSHCENPSNLPPGLIYRWVYGGRGGYSPGSEVSGAGDQPDPGMSVISASQLAASGVTSGNPTVTVNEDGSVVRAASERGGFGATGEVEAAHGGEAGE